MRDYTDVPGLAFVEWDQGGIGHMLTKDERQNSTVYYHTWYDEKTGQWKKETIGIKMVALP